MKESPHISRITVALLLAVAALWGQPEPGFQQSWKQYRFGLRLEGGALSEAGALNGRKVVQVNPGSEKEERGRLLRAEPDATPLLGGGLGVRMDHHRLSLYALWADGELNHTALSSSADGQFFSAGIDYRYDLLQQGAWRPLLGVGFHFSYRDLHNLYLPEVGKPRNARLSGNGVSAAAGVGWWWRERVAVLVETEYRLTAYRNIGLGDEGFMVDGYLFGHAWSPRLEFWIFL